MLAALGAAFDRLLDALFGGAYRKFGPKRYELRMEVRKLKIRRAIDGG